MMSYILDQVMKKKKMIMSLVAWFLRTIKTQMFLIIPYVRNAYADLCLPAPKTGCRVRLGNDFTRRT